MVRRAATLAVVLSLCTGLLPAASLGVAPGFSPGSPGVGDPYFPLDGNGGYNVQRYILSVRYNPATNVLRGVAEIRARAKKNLSKFNLDLNGLTVRSITVDGRQATWRRKGGELTVTPKLGLLDRKDFVVVINYDGVPKTINDLFGSSGFIHTDDGALVIGEPHVAATWFPVNDHPIDKAAYTFEITVPAGLEAIANGVLQGQSTNQGWTTWRWVADEPMASYLAGMAIGQFDVHAYAADGIKYWDAIDPDLFVDLAPAITPIAGEQFLFSDVGEPAYKRLTRTIDVPAGGAQLSFQVNRDTEGAFDFLFVEARTPGGTDWTTLPDENGHTSQDVGACPGFLGANPFLDHYLTPFLVDPGDPNDPFDDFYSCNPVGSSGVWHAATGMSDLTVNDGWEAWNIQLDNTGATPKPVEVSITYASDEVVQGRGVVIDDVVVSNGPGTTSFEADADPLDGWVVAADVPEGSAPNPNSWTIATLVPAVPGLGANAQASFARQPEIIAFESDIFGPYPFSAAGGIVDDEGIGFALENQTRPIYSPFFFFDPVGGDFVIVHELAHQWFGDSLAVERWQHIWLNEGFATYAEWLWSEREGFGTADEIFGFYSGIPADDPFWSLKIGDPGRKHLFDFPVYGRGAMTLHALRLEVGDTDFFEILRRWVSTQAGGNVTTDEFISLAEGISGENLDGLFKAWLFSAKKPDLGFAAARQAATRPSLRDAPAEVRSLAERLRSQSALPFSD